MTSASGIPPTEETSNHPILSGLLAFLTEMQTSPAVQELEQAALAALMAYITHPTVQTGRK